MVSSSVVPQVQAVFPQGALTKKIKVGLQAQVIDSELTAKLLGRGVAVSPVVTVEPRRRKFHKSITLSMPAPRPHTQGMTNQYSTSSAPTLRLLCSISDEIISGNFTKIIIFLREAIHVPFISRFVVYAKRTDETQAQLRMFCVTDDKEDKALERIERFIQVAKSRDVEVHEGKPIHLEFGGNLVPIAKSGEQLSIPFKAFRENRVAFPVMIKTQDLEPICRCQFMRDPKVPKGEPSPTPIAVLNIMVPEDIPTERISPVQSDSLPRRTAEQERIWRQRLNDPRSSMVVDNSLELALCRIGRDDIIEPQSENINERRIQRNIYQDSQASEEIDSYKADEDNKLKDRLDDSQMSERTRTEDYDQDEAKYSPEEKSFVDKGDMEKTESEESEEDEGNIGVPNQQFCAVKEKEPKLERTRSKPSPETTETEKYIENEVHKNIIEDRTEEVKEQKIDQFRKYDPSSPKPTPKHLQRHVRNESMRFPSGDFSNITVTPRKSVTDTVITKTIESKETFSKDIISQKEIDSARVAEKLEDGEKSPELVIEEKDVAETTLKHKIGVFETKISKEPQIDTTQAIKLTKEALQKHTMEQEQSIEYTQEFVRDQAKQMESEEALKTVEVEKPVEQIKSVKETIQQFDSKIKLDEKTKSLTRSTRTDSTIVQVSSEEDSEFLKKSTDSETETESQTTVKVEREKLKREIGRLEKQPDDGIKKDDEDEKIDTYIPAEKQIKVEVQSKFSGDDLTIVEKSTDKIEIRLQSSKSEITTKDSPSSETQEGRKVSQESSLPSTIDKADSLADLLQSTERDTSFISQTESKVYSKHRSDSLDETSQFSDLEDQIGLSPAHKPVLDRQIEETAEEISSIITFETTKSQTQEFLQYETEYSSDSVFIKKEVDKVQPKESPVISAKARQFIETVPEDDSVQECFFSKRIYSDSLEDSEHTDSRRHSEAESSRSDQSDLKAKVSSSDFDERAEYEGTADSGSGFGDEKFEESVGFTSIKIDPTTLESDNQETSEEKDAEVVFKKMTPKRHSRTESISITKLSDIVPDIAHQKTKQEFQMIVTEAEEIDKSFDKTDSDKISSESSREIEISERKSSDGISDKISSEDAVQKTSSEEEVLKDESEPRHEITKSVKEMIVDFERSDTRTSLKDDREIAKSDSSKIAKLTHGDSLDDVEGFPEDHVSDYVHKLPHIAEVSSDKIITSQFLSKEREEQIKREIIRKKEINDNSSELIKPTIGKDDDEQAGKTKVMFTDHIDDPFEATKDQPTGETKDTKSDSSSDKTKCENQPDPEKNKSIHMGSTTEAISESIYDTTGKISTTSDTHFGPDGEEIITKRVTETIITPSADEITKVTVTVTTKYPSGKETVSTSISESIKSFHQILNEATSTTDILQKGDTKSSSDIKVTTGLEGEEIRTETLTETTISNGYEITTSTITETIKFPSGKETISTKVSELKKSLTMQPSSDISKSLIDEPSICEINKSEDDRSSTKVEKRIGACGEDITITIITEEIVEPTGEEKTRVTKTEMTKYPSGKEIISTNVSESIKLHKTTSDIFISDDLEVIKSINQFVEHIEPESVHTSTSIGNNGEEINTKTITRCEKMPSGEVKQIVSTTITTTHPNGEKSTVNKISESIHTKKDYQMNEENIYNVMSEENKIDELTKSQSTENFDSTSILETQISTIEEQPDFGGKSIRTEQEQFMQNKSVKTSDIETKFDITKIRTDTLSNLEISETLKQGTSSDKSNFDLDYNVQDITKEEIKPVIDDILQIGTIMAATRSPTIEKDIKFKDSIETEKRSYDAKVPHKEERRHSCISPAISLERIAESEVEGDDEIITPSNKVVQRTDEPDMRPELKKSDSAMKQMADNIEIIIKQASEDVDVSSEDAINDHQPIKDITSQDDVQTCTDDGASAVHSQLKEDNFEETYIEKQCSLKDVPISKERPTLIKSLSRDSGEVIIMPKKKHPRTFSVQSSPDEVEEHIYTDSESDMDRAKVLEIIEPTSDIDDRFITSSFESRKLRTDSLDDADDFPEKEPEFFEENERMIADIEPCTSTNKKESSSPRKELDDLSGKISKRTPYAESLLKSDLVSMSTTESSVTTVVSTLTKSSEDEQKSVVEECTSADFSKLSGAELHRDLSKTSGEAKEEFKHEEHTEDRATPDNISKKSIDLTKDYSKSSIDSKDTSRDFATNELSKDSTADLTKDYSKVSIESVKETSRSLEEKTFSEDHSSLDISKTLASDGSDCMSKEHVEEERSVSKIVHFSSSSQETSVTTESKIFSSHDDKTYDIIKDTNRSRTITSEHETVTNDTESKLMEEDKDDKMLEYMKEIDDEVQEEIPDMKELNRRCSNLLEDISAQGAAIIRIDSSHVTQDLVSKFSKTPPPSPVDLTIRDKSRAAETSAEKPTGLQFAETAIIQESIIPETPTELEENPIFVIVDQPTITSNAVELVDRTIEKSIDVIDQIKQEQLAVKMEELQKSTSSDTFFSESRIATSTSTSSIHKTIDGQLKFQSINPEAVMTDMISKFGTTSQYSTVVSHKETETKKISGQEYFSETKQVSSSDDDSLIIKTEISHELRGQEHELKEKTIIIRDGLQTETSQKKMERAHEATAKRSDLETKTVIKSTDDTDIVKVEREFSEQGLYSGRQTKSEEKMTAIKDETVKRKHDIKISEREMSHEQWGKEYFTEPGELQDIREDDDKGRKAFVDSTLKIVETDEIVSSLEVSEKGKVVSSKVEHHKEESVIESKEHDDLSSGAPSFKSEPTEKQGSAESSPKSKSKSFKKDDEIYEVGFIKEIKVSTSPVKSCFSRTGSQDTQSESEVVPELPQDADTPKKEKYMKTVKIPQHQIEEQLLELSVQTQDSKVVIESSKSIPTTLTSCDLDLKNVSDEISDILLKTSKVDILSPSTTELSEETTSKDIMLKSAESGDTEFMVKSLESHEAEVFQKSIDSTVSVETLHPSEFSTEADSAFLTGTDQRREEVKLFKEKSLEDICSSGYDTDLSSAEFQAAKQEKEKIDLDPVKHQQPLTDLSVLEKTIDEVKQSLEAAQGEIISEKSDGSIKYKQSPSEFQFKILISPDRPEVITEEPLHADDHLVKSAIDDTSQTTDSILQKTSSQEEITVTDSDTKETVHVKESSPPLDTDISVKSDSGPHSILETESEVLSDKEMLSKGSTEVKLRVHKRVQSNLPVTERRSTSEVEGWSSSGESHYQSFEHTESRPLSSDLEVMMTAHSGTDFETALTSHDVSSQSLRTSKDYYTACSSLASRDSMRSLDSDASSHVASIDISDASETLVPSANELKEELMESSTYIEQFLHESEKDETRKLRDVSDEDISVEEEGLKSDSVEPVGKMKRSHEMRFSREIILETSPIPTKSESIEIDQDSIKEKEDTTISSQFKTDESLSSSISKLDTSISQAQYQSDYEEKQETKEKSLTFVHTIPFSVTKIEQPQRELVDVDSEIIPVGSAQYKQIENLGYVVSESNDIFKDEMTIKKSVIAGETSIPKTAEEKPIEVVKEEFIKRNIQEVGAIPFPITEKQASQREFVDVESEIIPIESKQYEEILKSKSDSSVPKTKVEKTCDINTDNQLESKQSSLSSLKTQEHIISTPHTPLSMPSQSSISTENGREYVLDDIYDISETPELKSDLITDSSRSELMVTTDEQTLHYYDKEQESPTSDEFEMVDKPGEMDDFVVIEEVAKEAEESDPEGKSVQIKSKTYVRRHDIDVEDYISKTSKKQESVSTSGSSDEDMQCEMEQRRLQAQELAEIEAGKRWIQMQFEGDPRYDYERVPLEDIKEEEMTDFDPSRIGSLSSQKESIGSYGSFRNSFGSLSESEMASRMRFRIKGENDDISISSLQEFENLERMLMEQYQQNSSSSQDSLNGSLPRRYILSRSQGDDISISSLKEFEGLESACLEALKDELVAKQKEALLLADPKVVSGSFLEQEKRSYDSSSDGSPPLKSGSPNQKSGSPSQKSGSPSQKGGSPSQKIGSYGSPSQRLLADSAAIRKLIDQQLALEQRIQESRPKVVTVKKYDDKGAFFVPVPEPDEPLETKSGEVVEVCTKSSSFICASGPSDGSAESIPGDCEEMMKILDQEEKSQTKRREKISDTLPEGGSVEVVRTTTVIQQRFVDGKKVSEIISGSESDAINIPVRSMQYDESGMSLSSEMSSSLASQPSELDSLMTVVEKQKSEGETIFHTKQGIITTADRPEDLDLSREGSAVRELSPSSGRSVAHSIISGKHFTDPASAVPPPGSNTMVSSLDTMDPVTAVQVDSLEHQSTSEHYSQYEVHEPDSDTERLERTIMFDSTDTLSAVSGDGSVREGTVEAPAPTFYIGDEPIVRGPYP
ncbi:unnamed protein product [Leptidea sinapis]|uniref:Ankyrin UPA domain-containing protein n=1 Tax=Leptidea sinapis TaxID=189913 RepID=A0A5E4PU19_9NEOP|nr:unnamed protein product [Leptidea sinapis]